MCWDRKAQGGLCEWGTGGAVQSSWGLVGPGTDFCLYSAWEWEPLEAVSRAVGSIQFMR